MPIRYFLCFFLSCFLQDSLLAQTFFLPKSYPSHSFVNPLSLPFAFVGNFGETRPNHFHSGLDMRTGGKENQAVYAAGEGYISRVKISAGGFGNAIYITHASGYTTVYAHLNKFFPKLEQFVRKQQYQRKQWDVDLNFFPDQFWVRKGSFIAWSGNTGSSQGPHLHFEVRNAKSEAPLNPLLFYSEIQDSQPPVIKQLAWYDGHKSIYQQWPHLLPLVKGKLKQDTIVVPHSNVFFAIAADDFMPMGYGTLGIFEMRMYADDLPVIAWQLDDISYDLTRYVNALADYRAKKAKGISLQLCRKLPNNKLPVYKSFSAGNGVIDLSDGKSKKIRIEVYDTRYNKSSVSFFIRGSAVTAEPKCVQEMLAGKRNVFKNQFMSLVLNEDALYDHICFTSAVRNSTNPYSYIYTVHDNTVPLHTYFDLVLNPKSPIPAALKDKVAVVLKKGATRISGSAAKVINQQVTVSVNEFGDYEIVTDQRAPVISTTLKDAQNISKNKILSFTVRDETTSVKQCTATVDGQWLRLVQKGNAYYYEMDDYFAAGKHELVIKASDENDNVATRILNLTR